MPPQGAKRTPGRDSQKREEFGDRRAAMSQFLRAHARRHVEKFASYFDV
jgi:hypothetical protein